MKSPVKQTKQKTVKVDQIVEDKLSSLLADIKRLLKPYRNDLNVEIAESNDAMQFIQITVKIYPR